jgi:hypothetical protein
MCLDMLPKTMIFNGNVLCLRCEFWIVCHSNACLIILSNLQNKFELRKIKRGKITFISLIKFFIGIVSLRACDKAIYSASAVESAISV